MFPIPSAAARVSTGSAAKGTSAEGMRGTTRLSATNPSCQTAPLQVRLDLFADWILPTGCRLLSPELAYLKVIHLGLGG